MRLILQGGDVRLETAIAGVQKVIFTQGGDVRLDTAM